MDRPARLVAGCGRHLYGGGVATDVPTDPSPPATVEVRLYGDLAALADADRDGLVRVPIGMARSVKDLVESLGVPHTEIGALAIDGALVGFDRLVSGHERVAVYPDPVGFGLHDLLRPPVGSPPRFMLDVHLGRLARHLRLLGFDTAWGLERDEDLAVDAVQQDRVLVTRDRGLLMRRAIVHGHLVRSQDPEEQLEELVARFGLAVHARPWTRCLACNEVPVAVTRDEVLERLPPRTRVEHDTFTACPGCGRVYWAGSHLDRLEAVVARVLDQYSSSA